MFNKDFYPTPKNLLEKLLEPAKKKYWGSSGYEISGTILEPSAGKGDIVNYLLSNVDAKDLEIHALEIEDELRASLSAIDNEKFAVIGSDFMKFEFYDNYDYIIMNPPFSKGAEHLLKAIKIAQQTQIFCILNAETINNPYTHTRRTLLAEIEKYGGTIRFEKGAFEEAERKTKVEVALIHINIVKETDQFDFDYIEEEDVDFEGKEDFIKRDALATEDYITNAQMRAEKVKMAYEEYLRAESKFKHYLREFQRDAETSAHFDDKIPMTMEGGSNVLRFDYFKKRLRSEQWSWVATKMNITTYMSSKTLTKFKTFITKQKKLGFNKENVFNLFTMVMQNRIGIMENSIVETFEMVTGREENRWLCWKTNKAFKCNRKLISPWGVKYGEYCSADDLKRFGSSFSLSYDLYHGTYFADLDKILCYIEGRPFTIFDLETKKEESNIITIYDALTDHFNKLGRVKTGDKFDSSCESTYFKLKFFKKGTIHLEFKDEELWKEFNYRACKGKMWLPQEEEKAHKNKYQQKEETFTNADMMKLLNG